VDALPLLPIPAQSLLEGRTELFRYDIPLPPWAVIVLLAAAGLVFHFLLRTVLHRWAKGTSTDIDDIVVGITSKAVPLWIALAILYVALEMDGDRHPGLRSLGYRAIAIGFIISLFWVVATLLLQAMARWAARNEQFQSVHPPLRFVLKAVAVVVGAVTVLPFFGVQVNALIATLGMGGLAVALALKDTLENFFAGLHIMADRPLAEGDTIQVHDTGDVGVVLRVGWRSTRIRTAENNILVVPNVKLSSGIVTNLSARDAKVLVRIQVGVSYDSDPERVRTVLLDELAAAAGKVPGLAAGPGPDVWLHPGFGPYSLDFTVRVSVDRVDQTLDVQDALRRRIFARLKAEGIAIPFPTNTVEITRMPGSN
jgi:small-conductance mechanosensitive channel